MLAFKFNELTKEYLGIQEAQIDPLKGGYLLPANCTFIPVPEYDKNTIPIFENDNWVIKKDMRGTWQVKLDDITFSKVDYIGDIKDGYQFITDEEYIKYQNDNDSFKVIDGVFVDISDTQEYRNIKTKKRQKYFEDNFLNIGTNKNFRLQPKGYANAQQSIDTVNAMVNYAGGLTEEISQMVLLYKTPDFTKPEECTEEWLIQNQFSLKPMTLQKWSVFYSDFTTKYAQKMYKQI